MHRGRCRERENKEYEIEKRKEDSIYKIKTALYKASALAAKLKEAQRIKDSIQNAMKSKKRVLKKKK
jgi:Skp family chaperone for outer membrane proteins